jgi:probable F420-dependent oxidoreductase
MKFGISTFITDYSIDCTELGVAMEDLGFDSLFVAEHTHIPTSRKTPFPGGTELPKQYSHTLDPFSSLGAVAAVTKNLLVGTGICLVMQHDPITLAKNVASLDYLSGGRFMFGIGGGWNEDEMNNHGTKYTLRWKILRERILAMKEIWTNEEAEYHGEFVDFDPIWSYPKPKSNPHPPVMMGGDGAKTLDRIIDYADEWMPIGGRSEHLTERMAELQGMAKAAGRDPIPVTIFGARPLAKDIEAWAEAGVGRCLFMLPSVPSAESIGMLKNYAEAMKEFS